jgi:hypothetical protein
VLPPVALILFAVLPLVLLRVTLYALLAAPLMPIIQHMGWVYRDKPMFLTYPAAIFAAVVWAIILFFCYALFGFSCDGKCEFTPVI